MEVGNQIQTEQKDTNDFECHQPFTWSYTLDGSNLLFKFFDDTVKEEKDVKKIVDTEIFPEHHNLKKIKKFTQGKGQQKTKMMKDFSNL